MEPFSLVTIASAAWEGFAGHKIDQMASKGLSAISRGIKKMRQDGELPPNHDLYKVLRLSMLDATDYLLDILDGILEITKTGKKSREVADWNIFKQRTYKWIKEWKKYNEKESILGKDDSVAYAEIEKMLIVNNSTKFKEVQTDLVIRVKSEWLKEWQIGIAMDIPMMVEELLMKGWMDDEKAIDWFTITTLLFAENLKEEKYIKARNAFHNRLLSEIRTETGIIAVTLTNLSELLNKTVKNYDFIKQKLVGNGNLIIKLKETTDQSLKFVKEIHSALKGSIRIEVLQKNKSISNLLKKINQLEVEAKQKFNEKEEYKMEMLANPGSKSIRKAHDATVKEWEEATKQLQRLMLDFDSIKAAYLRQKEVFDNIDWKTANDRLKRSKKLFFEGGNVKVLDNILLYNNREKDLKALLMEKDRVKKISENFSNEELMLALNRLRDLEDIERFEKAKQHFEISIKVYENYESYIEYASFLRQQNEHFSAIEIYKSGLRFLGDNQLIQKSHILNNLGAIYQDVNNYQESEITLTESLTTLRSINKKRSNKLVSEIALVHHNLGKLYFQIQRYRDSETNFSESVVIFRRLAKRKAEEFEPALAMALSNIGNLYLIEQRYDDTFTVYSDSLSLFHKLAEKNLGIYDQNIISTLNGLGILYMDVRRYSDSEDRFLESLLLTRKLAELNPDAFEPEMAKIIHNLGTLYNKSKNYKEAKQANSESVSIYRRLVEKKSDAYEPELMVALINEGNSFFYFKKYKEAELIFSEALSTCRRLVQKNQDAFEPDLAMILSNFGNLYITTERYAEAERSLLESLSIRQRLTKKNPNRFEPTVATTLANLGRLYYMNPESHDYASKRYAEALQLYLKLYPKNPDNYLKEILSICFPMANMFTYYGKKENAEEYLYISVCLLHQLQDSPEHQEYFLQLNDLLKRNGSSYDELANRISTQ